MTTRNALVMSSLMLLMPSLSLDTLAETVEPTAVLAPAPASSAGIVESLPAAPEKAKNAATDASSDPQPPTKASGNRRWLIKQRDATGTVKPRKTAPIKWASPQQQARCEALLPNLRESFVRARYYSIQGDSCKTAAHARRFLDAYRTCDTVCPADYLKNLGYRDLIPRNMQLLVELGTDRCQDRPKAVSGGSSHSLGASAAPASVTP